MSSMRGVARPGRADRSIRRETPRTEIRCHARQGVLPGLRGSLSGHCRSQGAAPRIELRKPHSVETVEVKCERLRPAGAPACTRVKDLSEALHKVRRARGE